MSEFVDKICASVTKVKKGGDHKVMAKGIADSTTEKAFKSLNKR